MSASVPLDNILVRPLTARDLTSVQDLHSKILPVYYPTSFFLQLLVIPTRICYVAYDNGQPIGFISAAIQKSVQSFISNTSSDNHPLVNTKLRDNILHHLNKPRLEILTLGVLPQYQQCGLARQLVQFLVDSFRRSKSCAPNSLDGTLIYANVSTSNTQALRFYERIGMTILSDVIRNLYRTLSYGSKDAYLVAGIFKLGHIFWELKLFLCLYTE